MKTAIIYGTTTGNTEASAQMIHAQLADALHPDLFDLSEIETWQLEHYELLIIGCPTWDIGELQADWDIMLPKLESVDLSNTCIALFGQGDAWSYADSYQDALGILHHEFAARGATLDIGFTSTEGYDFKKSKAVIGGQFCGLALDDDNEAAKSEQRINNWCAQLLKELGL